MTAQAPAKYPGSGSETLLFCIATVVSYGTGSSVMQFQLYGSEYNSSVHYFEHVVRRAKKCSMETIYSRICLRFRH